MLGLHETLAKKIKLKDEGIVLKGRTLDFENGGVLNPATIEVAGTTHMYYRAVDGKHYSSIGYCQLKNNKVVMRWDSPLLSPENDYERHGVEDPRITLIDGIYYLLYTVYDGKNALFAYATGTGLTEFTKGGIIGPQVTYKEAGRLMSGIPNMDPRYKEFEERVRKLVGDDVMIWEKDAVLFPKKIDGKFAMFHRVLPGIQLCLFEKFSDLSTRFWKDHLKNLHKHIVLEPKYPFEHAYLGGGCPPIETEHGWLTIYHAVEETGDKRIYHAGAVLLDLRDPRIVVGRLREPLFSPEAEWEKSGVVNNVVFPTGTTVQGDKLTVYYGAADRVIAAKSMSLSHLISVLRESGT